MTSSHLETDGSNVERNEKGFKKEVVFVLDLKGCTGFQEAEEEEKVSHADRTRDSDRW